MNKNSEEEEKEEWKIDQNNKNKCVTKRIKIPLLSTPPHNSRHALWTSLSRRTALLCTQQACRSAALSVILTSVRAEEKKPKRWE